MFTTEHRPPSENLIKSNDEYKWAKFVATGLLVIRLSRPYAAKPADSTAKSQCLGKSGGR